MTNWKDLSTLKGECLSCNKVSKCSQTDEQKIIDGFTCALYAPISSELFMARLYVIDRFGEISGAKAIMEKGNNDEEHRRS